MKSPRIRHLAFAVVAVTLAGVAAIAALGGADLYLHKRASRSAGVNVWGYRGPVAASKRPGEIRVAVIGGSTVFGYGLTWDQAFPAQLEAKLNAAASGSPRFSVVNLGYNNEGAFSFRFTLQDYAYLHADVICLYEGYNDLMGDLNRVNHSVYRHASPLFRATGYFPILPLVFREKAMALRHGGDLNAAYAADGKTVFQPTLASAATSGALTAAASIGDSIEQQIARFGGAVAPDVLPVAGQGCAQPWRDYCQSVSAAVDMALGAGQRVLFVTQPYLAGPHAHDRHVWQQRAVAAMLHDRYAGNPRFHHVDLGDAIDVRQPALAFDGMHLTAEGNARIAERLVQPVLTAVRGGGPSA